MDIIAIKCTLLQLCGKHAIRNHYYIKLIISVENEIRSCYSKHAVCETIVSRSDARCRYNYLRRFLETLIMSKEKERGPPSKKPRVEQQMVDQKPPVCSAIDAYRHGADETYHQSGKELSIIARIRAAYDGCRISILSRRATEKTHSKLVEVLLQVSKPESIILIACTVLVIVCT